MRADSRSRRGAAACLGAVLVSAGCVTAGTRAGPLAGLSRESAQAPSRAEPPSHAPGLSAAERDDILDRMAVLVSSAVARRDTDRPVFHGCIDWHSAVHGHWALFRIARVTGRRRDLAEAADRSLDPEGVGQEAAFLREHPYFEMPYGRAWFLRLAIEHERWSLESRGEDPLRLRPMAEETARSLMRYYAEFAPSPYTHEYMNASWALVQLYDYYRHTGEREGLIRVLGLIRRHFLAGGAIGFGSDRSNPEFFSPFGNWAYLVAKSQEPATLERFLKERPVSDEDLAPVTRLVPNPHRASADYEPAAHHLGMNWSRAWALRRLGIAAPEASDRERFARAYAEQVKAAMRHHGERSGDYSAYGHWVPQFAVYALTEGD